MEKRIIVGLSGSSGIIYGNRTLMHLLDIEDFVCVWRPRIHEGKAMREAALLIRGLFSVRISRLEGA